jgi:hypothetical protein
VIDLQGVINDFLGSHFVRVMLCDLVRKCDRSHALLREAKPVFAFTGLAYKETQQIITVFYCRGHVLFFCLFGLGVWEIRCQKLQCSLFFGTFSSADQSISNLFGVQLHAPDHKVKGQVGSRQ